MDELGDQDAWSLAEAVRLRTVSATEVLEAHLTRIEQRNPLLGAVWRVTEARARSEAAAVDAAVLCGDDPGPLAGVPVGWKDLIDTAGCVTTYGSAIWRRHVPARDADVVELFSRAGSVTLAKLSLDELAWATTGENPHFGTCCNPHDHERMPGGSSGGSAVSLASGMLALAPGTDTGGSIRCPASCCGVVGLKPTYGRVSLAGIHPVCPTFDHCGPMARSVRDCALQLEVMAGASPRDPRTPPVPVERYRDALHRGVKHLTVGIAERFFFEHSDAEVAARVRSGIEALAEAGANVVEFELEWPPVDATPIGFDTAEQAATLAGHWPSRRHEMGENVIRTMELADTRDTGYDSLLRQRIVEYRARMLEHVAASGVDLVVHPTEAFPPPLLGVRTLAFAEHVAEDVSLAMCGLTEVYNVLRWPAISVPCGRDALGLPVGCHIAAAPWREADCLSAAAIVEAAMRS